MGIMDKAKQFIAQHDEQIDSAASKAGDFVDKKTKGKYSDKIGKAVGSVHRATGDGKPGEAAPPTQAVPPAQAAPPVPPVPPTQAAAPDPAVKPGDASPPGV